MLGAVLNGRRLDPPVDGRLALPGLGADNVLTALAAASPQSLEDLRGILGLSDEVRNGFSQIRVSFRVRGDASPEALRQLVQQAVARSAVYDVLTHGVPISVDVAAS